MTLVEHVRELRSRLVRALAAVVVGAIVGYLVFPQLLDVLMAPYCAFVEQARAGESCRLIALRPLEPLSVRLKTSFVVGLFIAGPVIFYQLWRFVTPGLLPRERRFAWPFVVLSQVMFAVGILFAYQAIPLALPVLLELGGSGIEALLSADEYLSFFLTLSVAFGAVFEMPLILIFLAVVGAVRTHMLRRARPYAIVAIFVIAAVITPTTDAISLLLMAGPMVAFYELSILAAWLIERSRRRRAA